MVIEQTTAHRNDQKRCACCLARLLGGIALLYIGDCETEKDPHGFYGAFLQPCEFAFFKAGESQSQNACTDSSSELISKPVPVHWFFNVTEHFTKDDWDELSSDDLPKSADEPDQCVGTAPRCYSIEDEAIEGILFRLFADGDKIPARATHVQVDCRGDAVALSKLAYVFADRFEKSTPTIIAWLVTVLSLGFVATIGCVYGCFRVYRETQPRNYTVVAHDHYKIIADEEGTNELEVTDEKARFV